MEEPKRYFMGGLEKYQHFSTGLMFAVAAAAIQSAKVEVPTGFQTTLELSSWACLIGSAVLGLLNARSTHGLMMIHDELFLYKDQMKQVPEMKEGERFMRLMEGGLAAAMSKSEFREDLEQSFVSAAARFHAAQQSIQRRTTIQLWVFTIGLVLLALARALPHFAHQ